MRINGNMVEFDKEEQKRINAFCVPNYKLHTLESVTKFLPYVGACSVLTPPWWYYTPEGFNIDWWSEWWGPKVPLNQITDFHKLLGSYIGTKEFGVVRAYLSQYKKTSIIPFFRPVEWVDSVEGLIEGIEKRPYETDDRFVCREFPFLDTLVFGIEAFTKIIILAPAGHVAATRVKFVPVENTIEVIALSHTCRRTFIVEQCRCKKEAIDQAYELNKIYNLYPNEIVFDFYNHKLLNFKGRPFIF